MNAIELCEAVYCGIRCDKCGRKEYAQGVDDYMFAEMLDNTGWHMSRLGNVICPKCDRRKMITPDEQSES